MGGNKDSLSFLFCSFCVCFSLAADSGAVSLEEGEAMLVNENTISNV